MTYAQISALLEKYWDGDTTLEEERLLKTYFSAPPVDERLQRFAPLFAALRAEQSVELQRDNLVRLDARPTVLWRRWAAAAAVIGMLAVAGWWWLGRDAESHTLPVAETPINAVPESPVPAPEYVAPAPAPEEKIAATQAAPAKKAAPRHRRPAAVAVAQPNNAEAEQALEEIKAALALVSSKLNKGKNEAAKNLHQIENMDRVFKKKNEG